MTYRLDVKPELLRWARKRADADIDSLVRKFPKYHQWENGEIGPTYKQLKEFAKAVHAGIGYFFSSDPPEDTFPSIEICTSDDQPLEQLSLELIDTIDHCQLRQDWYREFICMKDKDPLPFIGSANPDDDAVAVAELILHDLKLKKQSVFSNWSQLLQLLIERTDEIGVLVMVSGVTINNSHRNLNPKEFKGFVSTDPFAPLVFINGTGSKEVQLFTLAHELAYLWLRKTDFLDTRVDNPLDNSIKKKCNKIAVEILVPLTIMLRELKKDKEQLNTFSHIERRFGVSSSIARYWMECADKFMREEFRQVSGLGTMNLQGSRDGNKGGYYSILTSRLNDRFARAVITDTLEGQTLLRDALNLLGIKKIKTFNRLASYLGISDGIST